MATTVVDRLEVVKVDKRQSHPRVAIAGLFQGQRQALLKGQTVGQAGQGIVVRQVL
ncbi:hypothetical protein D9M72_654680 [compost metagenome]